MPDYSGFLEIQTRTPWGRTLADFAAWCAPSPGWCVLDIGCGPGLLPALFVGDGCRATGVDLERQLLAARLAPDLSQADAYTLPFAAASFDLLTATNLLFLLEHPLRALMEWRRLLRPRGRLCLLNPSEHLSVQAASETAQQRGLEGAARDSLLGWARNAEAHTRWTEQETRRLLESAGLRMLDCALRVGPGYARYCSGQPA